MNAARVSPVLRKVCMACVFSGDVMRAAKVQQLCQLRFENVPEIVLADRRVISVRVKVTGMARANGTGGTGALIAKA